MSIRDQLEAHYDSLQSVTTLVSGIALNIAEAQERLDRNYIESLSAFSEIVLSAMKSAEGDEKLTDLVKMIAPSRYQFTETVIEVRADLQMGGSSELGIGGTLGVATPVFAAAINASYAKRTAYDYRAAALIRTVLNAVTPDLELTKTLLDKAGQTKIGEMPKAERMKALLEAFGDLPGAEIPDEDVIEVIKAKKQLDLAEKQVVEKQKTLADTEQKLTELETRLSDGEKTALNDEIEALKAKVAKLKADTPEPKP